MENQENYNAIVGLLAGTIPVVSDATTGDQRPAAIGPDGLSNRPPEPVEPAERKRRNDECIARFKGWLIEVGDGSERSVEVMQRIIQRASNAIEQGYLWPFDQDLEWVQTLYKQQMQVLTTATVDSPSQPPADAAPVATPAPQATLDDVVFELQQFREMLSNAIRNR